ncbi:hypothetical protein [Janibacter sp. G1551]|uniref:hypothetical protein n=1 Tax=Janibacter sp. G1551 TaxID=3420440 RepID=UPI003D03541E
MTAIVASWLGVAYLARAIGDTGDGAVEVLTWLSPLGWAEKVAPFGANRIALVVPAALVLAVGCAAGFALLERRDLGAGILPSRLGPAHASAALSGPFGLAWRLQRGAMLGWTIIFAVLGVVVGSLSSSVSDMMDNPAIRDMLEALGGDEGTLMDIFLATEIGFSALGAGAYGISAVLRAHGEEQSGHSETVLATGVRRSRLLGAHVGIATLGVVWLLVVLGVSIGWAHGRQVGDVGGAIASLVPAALASAPAAWVCVGIATALHGWLPRWAPLAWVAYVAFFALGEFSALLGLPDWMADASPFTHVPQLPGGDWSWTPLVWTALVAGGLVAAGFVGHRSRDLT